MRRWAALLCLIVLAVGLAACTRGRSTDNSIADLVLRAGEDVGTEVQTFDGQMAPGLQAALNADNPNAKDQLSLPTPPGASLVGSGRVARSDGSLSYFVMYQVKSSDAAVSASMSDMVDTPPWQVIGGQLNEGVEAFNFQSTRNPGVTGNVVVQPLPTSDRFDMVVSRNGKNKTLSVHRLAFIPVLGADFEERDGGLVVSRVVPGEAATSGLQQNDRIVSVGGKDVKDQASLNAALRALAGGKDVLTSVVYIMRIAPDQPLQSTFSEPVPETLPKSFPAPFLVLNGELPVAVRWSGAGASGQYQITLLTKQAPADVLKAYRQVIPQQKLTIANDETQGSATQLGFASADGMLTGTLTVDTFGGDPSYAVVSLDLGNGASGGSSPGGSTPLPGTGTPGPEAPLPSATAAPSATP